MRKISRIETVQEDIATMKLLLMAVTALRETTKLVEDHIDSSPGDENIRTRIRLNRSLLKSLEEREA